MSVWFLVILGFFSMKSSTILFLLTLSPVFNHEVKLWDLGEVEVASFLISDSSGINFSIEYEATSAKIVCSNSLISGFDSFFSSTFIFVSAIGFSIIIFSSIRLISSISFSNVYWTYQINVN